MAAARSRDSTAPASAARSSATSSRYTQTVRRIWTRATAARRRSSSSGRNDIPTAKPTAAATGSTTGSAKPAMDRIEVSSTGKARPTNAYPIFSSAIRVGVVPVIARSARWRSRPSASATRAAAILRARSSVPSSVARSGTAAVPDIRATPATRSGTGARSPATTRVTPSPTSAPASSIVIMNLPRARPGCAPVAWSWSSSASTRARHRRSRAWRPAPPVPGRCRTGPCTRGSAGPRR